MSTPTETADTNADTRPLWQRWFGVRKRATDSLAQAPPPPLFDLVRFESLMVQLKRRYDETNAKARHYYLQALKSARAKQVEQAANFYAHHRFCENRAIEQQKVLLSLDQQFEILNGSQINAMSVEALRMGTAELGARLRETDLEAVEKVRDEFAALSDQAQTLTRELARPLNLTGDLPLRNADFRAFLADVNEEGEKKEEEEEARSDTASDKEGEGEEGAFVNVPLSVPAL